jgi:biopolymer transport protein ExbD
MSRLVRREKRLFEPPAILLTDLAFNLVIFFVVCASMEPSSGRKQPIPRGSKDQTANTQSAQNVEVVLTRTTVAVNGAIVPVTDLQSRLQPMVSGKTRMEDRMIVVKSSKDTPYHRWITVTSAIEAAGGVVALQTEDSREVVVP